MMKRITSSHDLRLLIQECDKMGFLGYKSKYTIDSFLKGLLPGLRVYSDLEIGNNDNNNSWSKLLLAYVVGKEENLTTLATSQLAADDMILNDLQNKRTELFGISKDAVLTFAAVDEIFRAPISKFSQNIGFDIAKFPCKMFRCLEKEKASPSLYQPLIPKNGYLGPLLDSHTTLVNNTWPYGTNATMDFVRHTIQNFDSVTLFIDNKPVCWNLLQPFGAIGMLYTLPEYRKKKYGAIVMMAMVDLLLKKGHTPFFYVVAQNKASLQLCGEFLKFEKLPREQDWIILKPRTVSKM